MHLKQGSRVSPAWLSHSVNLAKDIRSDRNCHGVTAHYGEDCYGVDGVAWLSALGPNRTGERQGHSCSSRKRDCCGLIRCGRGRATTIARKGSVQNSAARFIALNICELWVVGRVRISTGHVSRRNFLQIEED